MRKLLNDAEATIRMRGYAEARWGYRQAEDGEVEADIFDGAVPEGWTDSPANVGLTDKPEPKDELFELADSLGLKVDQRWSTETLAAKIEEAQRDNGE